MLRKIDWESQIGRRLKMRDLHVFFTVAQRGSMAKAAAHLGVSPPTVSEVIADLEHALGVPLLDRTPQGVEPTIYGQALLKQGLAAFDELKQGIRNIELLSDPTAGELSIGCPEAIAVILPPILESFYRQYPRVTILVDQVRIAMLELSALRERKVDLVIGRISAPIVGGAIADDLNIEALFEDRLVVAAGLHSRWARRRKIDLAELADEPWILATPDTWAHRILPEAFRARGLNMPKISLMAFSVHLRTSMVASGEFITALPSSNLRFQDERLPLKELPVDLPVRPWRFSIVTLKNRTLNPVAERFIKHVREFTRSISLLPRSRKPRYFVQQATIRKTKNCRDGRSSPRPRDARLPIGKADRPAAGSAAISRLTSGSTFDSKRHDMMLITVRKSWPRTSGRAKAQVYVASQSDERRQVQLAQGEIRQLPVRA